jgi:hypothetical protein
MHPFLLPGFFLKLNLVRRIVASIACNFGFPGSDLLDYTTLNVKPIDQLDVYQKP